MYIQGERRRHVSQYWKLGYIIFTVPKRIIIKMLFAVQSFIDFMM